MSMVIPKHVQIETLNGVCTAKCKMCIIFNSKRKPVKMEINSFRRILEKFLPYQQNIEYLTLHGWSEPLLDKELPEKVKISKELGFKGVGFASNCTELSESTSLRLLDSGLDTMICSIDGIKKETHESIREGTDFDKVVANVMNFIELRNKRGKTRILIRFIRQESNKEEWDAYYEFWNKHISEDYGDQVVKFDIHNCAGELEHYDEYDVRGDIEPVEFHCDDLWDRLIILSDGTIAFCDADADGDYYELGNALEDDPIEVFNNEHFEHARRLMKEGKVFELERCRDCTIPRSRFFKDRTKV